MSELPLITVSFAVGELSYSKVRALTRVATPANEQMLVDLARCMTASHLERTVRSYKPVSEDGDEDTPTDSEAQQRERYVSIWWDDDGTLCIKAKLPPAEAAMVIAALKRAADAIYRDRRRKKAGDATTADDVPAGTSERDDNSQRDDVPAGTHEGEEDDPRDDAAAEAIDYAVDGQDLAGPWLLNDVPAGTSGAEEDGASESPRPWNGYGARWADALVAMAETVVADGLRPGSGPNRHTVVIHTTAEALIGPGDADDDHRPYLENGPRLAAETVRRLMCDSSLTFALEGPDGKVINVTPRAPSVPAALARAVKLRDGCCVFPGCTRQAFFDIHHIHHRADGGENSLTNLACLCPVHHRMVHEGGFRMTSPEPGRFEFHRPDGTLIATKPFIVPAGDQSLRNVNADHGIQPTEETSVPDWDGRHPNYAMVLDLLLHADGRLDYQPPKDFPMAS